MTDKQAAIIFTKPIQTRDNQFAQRMVQAAGLYRTTQISCLLTPEKIVHRLRQFQPHVFGGYAGVLARIAQFAGAAERQAIRPRFIVSGGEVLTPFMRQQITAAFAAPVFDTYGCHEFSRIAWECKQTGEYHTCDDNVIVEVLKDGRAAETGERGEVVGTNLHSFAMPFIRYRLGDIVTKGSATCPCGQPFSTIREVQGRMVDYFLLPGGRVMHPYEIAVILRDKVLHWMREYQLIQEREDRIVLRAVPFVTPSSQELTLIQESVNLLLGSGVKFKVILVPELKLQSSGKFRVYRSLVQSAYDGIDWDYLQTKSGLTNSISAES